MSKIENKIQAATSEALKELFNAEVASDQITLNETRKEFDGDLTVVIFPLLRYTRKKPEESGELIGEYLLQKVEEVDHYNVVKGFLNLSLNKTFWQLAVQGIYEDDNFGLRSSGGDKVMVEYSSPNTNKPLHLGHIRNNVLGYAVSGILEANGHEVIKANLINDRGIHICKSMLAWKHWGNGETPESTGMKGDHLAGKFYVEFDKQYKKQIKELVDKGVPQKEAEKQAPLLLEAQEMLRNWEAEDPEVRQLWETMNGWVYDGFGVTYKNLGVSFDKLYHESDTYIYGKQSVNKGLDSGLFFRKDDGSVWVDLTEDGLDEKLLLRADGTSVYMTQDIGTAELKYNDYEMDRSIYVVGNEQDYHFKVLKLICQKLGQPKAEGIAHLSYGMVELPSGKMKSREGTVVDADDLIEEMIHTVKERTKELGKIDEFTEEEAEENAKIIALGALKFFLLKIDPRKNMMFNPEESIDFHGYTGTFVQYNYVRMRNIGRKFKIDLPTSIPDVTWTDTEKSIIKMLNRFPQILKEADKQLSPAVLCDYSYELAKIYSKYWGEVSILGEQDIAIKTFRVILSSLVARTIRQTLAIVGIDVPERM